jgi:hypothetical protein
VGRTALVAVLWAEGFHVGPPPGDPCLHCQHEWGNHLLIAEGNPLDGGYASCPFQDCGCRITWDIRTSLDATD